MKNKELIEAIILRVSMVLIIIGCSAIGSLMSYLLNNKVL